MIHFGWFSGVLLTLIIEQESCLELHKLDHNVFGKDRQTELLGGYESRGRLPRETYTVRTSDGCNLTFPIRALGREAEKQRVLGSE